MEQRAMNAARDLIAKESDLKVGDHYIHNPTQDTHVILGVGINQTMTVCIIHHKTGKGKPLLEVTELLFWHTLYTPVS